MTVSQLIVYYTKAAPILIDDPDTYTLISHLDQLDYLDVKALSLYTSQGCMTIAPNGSKLIVDFEDHDCVVIRPREIVSRQVGTEIALFFLEDAGVPAGRSRIPASKRPHAQYALVG